MPAEVTTWFLATKSVALDRIHLAGLTPIREIRMDPAIRLKAGGSIVAEISDGVLSIAIKPRGGEDAG